MIQNHHRTRIFGIGLNKTGTTTLDAALQHIGYRTLHWGGDATVDAIRAALDAGLPALSPLDDDIDAVSDIGPISKQFDVVDRQYPHSKFILTTRPIDDWLDSRRRHVEKNQRKAADGVYTGRWLRINEKRWIRERRHHHRRVRAYFANRPDDLLEIDITAGDGWEPLCTFLRHPIPEEPFPWQNKYQPDWPLSADR